MTMPDRHVNAASWRIAAELTRHKPAWHIADWWRNDGEHANCLTLIDRADQWVVQLNRSADGHIYTPGAPDPANTSVDHGDLLAGPGVWKATNDPHGIDQILTDIWRRLQIIPAAQPPGSSARTLTYRVIAALLAATLYDRVQHHVVSGVNPDRMQADGTFAARDDLLGDNPEIRAFRPQDVWILLRGDHPIAWLANGYAGLLNGDRINLTAHRAHRTSIPALATAVLAGAHHPTGRGHIAPPLAGTLVLVPDIDVADPDDLVRFAATYRPQERLTSDLVLLSQLLAPLRHQVTSTQAIPRGTGVDAARALLYALNYSLVDGSDSPGREHPMVYGATRKLVQYIHQLTGGCVPRLQPGHA